jgi:murein DD-endopeptidase MepM/ murein hydrolase activator NlpD
VPYSALLLALLIASPAVAQDSPFLNTSFFARAMQPGEVVRLDIACACGGARPTANAFGQDIPLFVGSADGRWRGLIGIDLDTKPGTYTVTVRADRHGETAIVSTRLLHVIAKRFPTRRLRVAPDFVEPPPSAQDRIEHEAKLMESLFANVSPPIWEGSFRLPVRQLPVSNFGSRSVFNGQPRNPHGGVDFRSPTGTPIAAPAAGEIVLAESLYFTGNTVIIDHGLGLYTVFAHLSKFSVAQGDRVDRGAQVGLVGATGRVTGPHLHWTVRLHGKRVDPLSLVFVTRSSS